VRFVPVEILPLLFNYPFCAVHFARMLALSAYLPVARRFAFLLALLVLVGIHVYRTVHTIHNLYRTKVYPLAQRGLHDFRQHLFKNFQLTSLNQPLAQHAQRRVVRRFLIHCKPHKGSDGQVLIQMRLLLTLAHIE
jgi:hypothetical protein